MNIKKILVFSNGEKIGDGLIKIPFLSEIKKRLPNTKLYWLTNDNKTVYSDRLKNIASEYIDEIFEQAKLQPFFWQKISNKYEFEKMKFDFIIDTQKTLLRTIALKRIRSDNFISSTAGGFFSTKKISKKNRKRQYYLIDLFDLLDLVQKSIVEKEFKFKIPIKLLNKLDNFFNSKYSYIGYAPGAGEKNKIWNINNFIHVIKYFEAKNYKSVFFIGPEERKLKNIIKKKFPHALFPEEKIIGFSGPEIVMASTKYLLLSLSNDSGISHMLSTNYSPLLKLFGPKDSQKFTPISNMIYTINSSSYGSNNIDDIPSVDVVEFIEKKILSK